MENNLGRDSVPALVRRIALPSMLAQFVSVLYSIVDRMYIGNIPETGDLALAGAGVCGPVVTLIGSVAFLVGTGGAPLLSMKLGEGDKDAARRILANCFLMLAVFSALLVVCVLPIREPMLRLFGASDASYPYADQYFTIYLCGTFFALMATGMNQFIICQGYGVHLPVRARRARRGHRDRHLPVRQLRVRARLSVPRAGRRAHHPGRV